MHFKTLSPSILRKLLETEQDELTTENETRISAIKRTACPRCGSSLHPCLNAANPFGAGPLPRLNAKCPECSYETTDGGIVISTGDPTKVEDPLPIIRVNEDR